jgi:hypothetical protein
LNRSFARPGFAHYRTANGTRAAVLAIDRRRGDEYLRKRPQLPETVQLALDIVEETVLTDPIGAFRRKLPDGTIVDLSSYDEYGLIVTFEPMPDGNHLFIDFIVAE